MKKIKINSEKIYIFGFGPAGHWASENVSSKVSGFIDNDLKKNGKSFNEIKCLSVENAQKQISENDVILVSTMDVQDVIYDLEKKFPLNKKIFLGEVIEEIDISKSSNSSNKTIEFLEYTINAVKVCHKSYFDKDLVFARSIDIVITEKCTLKCKDCSNLMQFYESPEDHSFEKVTNDFSELIKSIDLILEVRLIGGEPFINKEIYEFIDFYMKQDKVLKVVVYTNATIKLKQERLLKYKDDHKLVFSITNYGLLSKSTEIVINMLENLNIAYRSEPPNNWTDSGKIIEKREHFLENQDIFEKCCAKNTFTQMNGKLYRCPFAANAEQLKAIPESESNSININDDSDTINKFILSTRYIDACSFCNGRSHDMPEIVPAVQTKIPLKYIKINSL
jgi:organic radical activating enzyme